MTRDLRVVLARTTVVLILLTLIYYVLPSRPDQTGGTIVRLALSLVALGVLLATFRAHVRRSREVLSPSQLRIQWLLSALYVLILVFALTYSVIAEIMPGQFVGIDDRTDALYFSVTVVSTVGLGDIHPAASVGQLLVAAHMVLNLLYLGTALRLLSRGTEVPS
jgi:hypothetical protein